MILFSIAFVYLTSFPLIHFLSIVHHILLCRISDRCSEERKDASILLDTEYKVSAFRHTICQSATNALRHIHEVLFCLFEKGFFCSMLNVYFCVLVFLYITFCENPKSHRRIELVSRATFLENYSQSLMNLIHLALVRFTQTS